MCEKSVYRRRRNQFQQLCYRSEGHTGSSLLCHVIFIRATWGTVQLQLAEGNSIFKYLTLCVWFFSSFCVYDPVDTVVMQLLLLIYSHSPVCARCWICCVTTVQCCCRLTS